MLRTGQVWDGGQGQVNGWRSTIRRLVCLYLFGKLVESLLSAVFKRIQGLPHGSAFTGRGTFQLLEQTGNDSLLTDKP